MQSKNVSICNVKFAFLILPNIYFTSSVVLQGDHLISMFLAVGFLAIYVKLQKFKPRHILLVSHMQVLDTSFHLHIIKGIN